MRTSPELIQNENGVYMYANKEPHHFYWSGYADGLDFMAVLMGVTPQLDLYMERSEDANRRNRFDHTVSVEAPRGGEVS